MTDLKKKFKTMFDKKFSGNTVTSNIVDTSASTTTSPNVNFFNRVVKKK